MNTLDSLFDWVLNASARASVLVLAVLVVRMLLKKSLPARWRYALWLPVLAALVLPGIPLLPSSVFPSPVEQTPPVAKVSASPLPKLPRASDTQPFALPANVTPALPESEISVAAVPPNSSIPAVASEIPTTAAATPSASVPWRKNFSLAWLAGVVLAVGVVGGSYALTLRRIRRRAVPAAPELLERIAGLARSVGLRRAPRVWLSASVASPAVCGWLRPTLLLNATFPADLMENEADMVLRHELTHIRRGDLLLNPFLCGLLALHWFNPLLWLAFSRVRADREAACDADVLRDESDANRAAYGQTLLKMEETFPPSGMCLGFVGILQRGSLLRDRIQSIIAQPKLNRLMKAGLALGIIGLAVLGLAKASPPMESSAFPLSLAILEQIHDGRISYEVNQDKIYVSITDRFGDSHIHLLTYVGVSNAKAMEILKAKAAALDKSGSTQGQPTTPAIFQGRGEWGPEVVGLSCRITPERSIYSQPGEAMTVLVEIRNTSQKPVTLSFDPRMGTEKMHAKGTPRETDKEGTLKLTFSEKDSKNFDTVLSWFPSPLKFAAVRKPNGKFYPPMTSTQDSNKSSGTFILQPNDTYAEINSMAVSPVKNGNTGEIKPGKGNLSAEVALLMPESSSTVNLKSNAVGIGFNSALFSGRGEWNGWRTGANDVESRITPEQTEYEMGEPVRLLVEIRNNGDKEITLKPDGRLLLEVTRAAGSSYGGRSLPFPADGDDKGSGVHVLSKTTFSKVVTYDWGRAEWESDPAHGPFRMLVGDYRVGAQFIGLSNPGSSNQNLLFNPVPLKVIPLPAAREAQRRVEEFHRSLSKEQMDAGNKPSRDVLLESKAYQEKVRQFFADLPDRESRLAALHMLSSLYVPVVNRELATELLAPLIRDEDAEVRAEAASAIAHNQCGALYAKDLIVMLDGDPNKATLLNLVGAMRSSGYEPFVSYLGKLLRHPDARVRELTIDAIVALSPETAPALITPLLNDQNGDVKRAAEEGLRQIAERAKDHTVSARHGEVELFCQNLNPDGSEKNGVSYKGTQFPMSAKFGQKGELDLIWQFVENRDGADVYQVSVAYTTDPAVKTPDIKWADPANAPGRGKPALRKVAFTGKPQLVFEDGERRITLRKLTFDDRNLGNYTGNTSVQPGDLIPAPFNGRGEWGPEVAGLSCRITTEKTEYAYDETPQKAQKNGENVRLLVEVRNNTNKPVMLGHKPSPASEPLLHLTLSQGTGPTRLDDEGLHTVIPLPQPGQFGTSYVLPFPRGIQPMAAAAETTIEPKTTLPFVLSVDPWGPHFNSTGPLKPGKIHLSAALWQFLTTDGNKTVLPFKPVEFTVKARNSENKTSETSQATPAEKSDADYKAITQRIADKVVALKTHYPVLEKMQAPKLDEKGEGTLYFEHGVKWVLDDPSKRASKTNANKAFFEPDGFYFRLHFYRGQWQGAAMFNPIIFGDLNLWFDWDYYHGSQSPAAKPLISAIGQIIKDVRMKVASKENIERVWGQEKPAPTGVEESKTGKTDDPSWAEFSALLGKDVSSPEVKKFVAAHQLSEITKGPSGSFTPKHYGYSLLYDENHISTIVMEISPRPEGSGEKYWRTYNGDLPAGIQKNHLRKDIVALLGEPVIKDANTWNANGLEIRVLFNSKTGSINELYISKSEAPKPTPVAPSAPRETGYLENPPNTYTGETTLHAGSFNLRADGPLTTSKDDANPSPHQLANGIRLYTDAEAEAFRAKLDTLKYPTTPEAASKELGIDLKRLTGKAGLMKSDLNGMAGASWVKLSENYWISFQFQLYLQGPDGKLIQNDKGEHDKVSIYTRVDVREVHKKEDQVKVSIHDDTLFVDAVSPSGIGGTRLALTSGTWPKKVVVRLKYEADKPFRYIEGPGATLEEKGKQDEYLKLERFPKNDGYEASIPPTERKTLYLHWVDAYRN